MNININEKENTFEFKILIKIWVNLYYCSQDIYFSSFGSLDCLINKRALLAKVK